MSESNWRAPAEKPSGSPARVHDGAAGHEQRAGLEQVAARRGGQGVAGRDPRDAALDVQARPPLTPGRVERHVSAGDPARAQLAEGDAPGSREEAADERLLHAPRGAPGGEARLPAQDDDPQLGERRIVAAHVHGRLAAVGEADAQAAVAPGRGLEGPGDGERGGHRRRASPPDRRSR
jgi:hypothetical protein